MTKQPSKKMKQIKTMEELSAEIGVSRPTLSKYFADQSSVRESMRARIEKGLSEVDYVPNFFARNMNRRNTRLFGVVIPHANDFYFMELLAEIEQRAKELDYSILIQNSHNDPAQELLAVENFRSMNAEGILIAPMGSEENASEFKRLRKQVPMVFVNTKYPGLEKDFSFVGSDNRQSTRLMVDYLSRSGKPPVFLKMPSSTNSNGLEREAGYHERMAELGFDTDVLMCEQNENNSNFEAYAYKLMRDLFAKGEYQDATILCANDRLAMGVLRAANEAGLFENRDAQLNGLRVAGHDNHALSSYVWPSLTTVSQDIKLIARTAVDCLSELTQVGAKKPVVEHLFKVQLQLRDSA
ncbi:LacI family transcriptional regulator [Leucothrix sargassi]|nr:LacI family transcriptional regulator [Leucothrix sargassi]